MKKTVALLLALLLLLPSMIVVNAADGITIDGKLDEAMWLPNAWINIGSGDWQDAHAADVTRNESVNVQYRTDDANLYVGVKMNFKPQGVYEKVGETVKKDHWGNGKGTTFRIWTFADGLTYKVSEVDTAYTTYNYIVEYAYRPTGSVFALRENRNPTGNTSTDIAATSGVTAAEQVGENSWTFELKIPFTAIKVTDSVRAFSSVGTPVSITETEKDGKFTYASNSTNTLWYPQYLDNQFGWNATALAEITQAFAPYTRYHKDRAMVLKFSDIKIGNTYVAPRPAGSLAIDNYGGFAAAETTILKHTGTTIWDISRKTNGTAKDYNYFNLVAVDKDNKVVSVNYTLGRPAGVKSNFVVPDGGYVLLFNENKAEDKDLFKTIAAGDVVTLTGVDLATLKAGKASANLTGASFTFKKGDAAASKAIVIDNFGGYVEAKTTIMARVDVLSTVGAISGGMDYQWFDMVVADATGKITNTYLTYEKKDQVAIPEGGFAIATHADKPIDVKAAFQGMAKDDVIKLYNIDLNGVAPSALKINTPGAGFAVKKAGSGVINASDIDNITISDTKLLTDGDKATTAGDWAANGAQAGVQLIANKNPTNAAINPEVSLVRNLGAVKRIDKVDLSFYHCYGVMIGLPKNNTVYVYTSVDGFTYKRAGVYKINGEAKDGEFGTVETVIDIPDADAQFIKVSYLIGPSGLTTDGKVVWEFTAMTEFGYTEKALGSVKDWYVADGLEALYSGKDNTGKGMNSYATTWADLSGKGLDITGVKIDTTNYFTGDAYRFKDIKTALPAKITDIVNGDEYTVEIAIGEFASLGLSYNTLMNSENDYFSLFRLNGEDKLVYKAYPHAAAARPTVAGGLDLIKNSTITITAKVGGNQTMYVDGVMVAQMPYTAKLAANAMFFGWDGTAKNFSADYKGIRFYSKELTSAQVASNAKADRDINYITFAPINFVGLETLAAAPSAGALPAKIKDVLVSSGKPYTILANGGHRGESYTLNFTALTDGTLHEGDIGGGLGINTKYAEIVIDLGEVRNDLYKFRADSIGEDWGIAKPNGIKVAVSDNGTDFKYVGEAKTVADNFFTVTATTQVSGRYVKFFLDNGSHVWLSEIEVYAAEADTTEPETSEPETSEPETSEPETSAPETSAPDTTPETFDSTFLFIALIVLAAGVVVITRRKRA